MPSGEHLCVDMLETIWSGLVDRDHVAIAQDGGIEQFLRKRAPGWTSHRDDQIHLYLHRETQDRRSKNPRPAVSSLLREG